MGLPDSPAREDLRLLRAGMTLFLLSLFVGLALPRFAAPRLALSTHLLGIMKGTFLLAAGLAWPKLSLTRALSRAGSYFAVYGCAAAWTANLLAAVWKAGKTMLPMAAGEARGSDLQERIIAVGLISSAVALISAAALVLWGLRGASATDR